MRKERYTESILTYREWRTKKRKKEKKRRMLERTQKQKKEKKLHRDIYNTIYRPREKDE